MKWLWAVALGVAVLAGCRSSQPATNPFLRTTVPPPATGAVVVTPGEPYAQGLAPPVVTQPAPVAPPFVTQPAPGAPVAAPPPMAAPPPPAQPGGRFQPPGGSYLYHQSSNEYDAAPSQGGPQKYPVQQAGFTESRVLGASPAAPTLQATAGNSRADPPPAMISMPATPAATTLRIVGETTPATAAVISSPAPAAFAPASGAPTASATEPAFRVVASGGQAAIRTTTANSTGASATTTPGVVPAATMMIAAPATSEYATARFTSPTTGAVVQAAFQPAGSAASDYAHAADYATLRGRLEHSISTRQWKLRYIPIDGQTDSYGGSVVLADNPALAQFQAGDLVEAQGALTASTSGFAPHYQLRSIQRVVR